MVDVLYLAWNRLEFTKASFESLLANTAWGEVGRLFVHDDGSTDGTDRWLLGALDRVPASVEVVWRCEHHGGPVAAMNHYLVRSDAQWIAKIDNDACVPPGWLEALLTVAGDDVDLIGAEAGMTAVAGRDGIPWDGIYRLEPCTHIGGIGLMRAAAFRGRMPERGRFGFQEAQLKWSMRRGWITPDLPLVLLDRLPFEPWLALDTVYEAAGWQRPWPKWDPKWMAWAWQPFFGVVEGCGPDTVAA